MSSSRITLGGSAWLRESTAAWKAEQQAIAGADMAANVQAPLELGDDWPPRRLHKRGQLDRDPIICDVLYATALRYLSDFVGSNGQPSEVQRERLAAFKAATLALGPHYLPAVAAIVLGEPGGRYAKLQEVGEQLGYGPNRAACCGAALERLNQGLRKLYGVMGDG
jgi:hypothetical protein